MLQFAMLKAKRQTIERTWVNAHVICVHTCWKKSNFENARNAIPFNIVRTDRSLLREATPSERNVISVTGADVTAAAKTAAKIAVRLHPALCLNVNLKVMMRKFTDQSWFRLYLFYPNWLCIE